MTKLRMMAGLVAALSAPGLVAQPLYSPAMNVTDAKLKEMVALKKVVRELDLHRSQVTDEGLKHLTPLEKLTVLSLANTRVTDAGRQGPVNLDKLQSLHPRRNAVM